MLNTFVVYVEDKPGVLARVAVLIRRRVFNIETLTVGRSEAPGVSRMTIVVESNEQEARRIEANLYKLVNVLWVQNVTQSCVSRDLSLVKVGVAANAREELAELGRKHGARILDEDGETLMFEIIGNEDQIDRFLASLDPYRVIEMVRTGRIAMTRCGQAENPVRSVMQQGKGDTEGLCCR